MTAIEMPALPAPKVALVTGGNSGIGKATAARLAALGSSVVVGYNSRRSLAEEVIEGLPGRGHLALRIAIDDPASISEAATHVERQYERLDVLGVKGDIFAFGQPRGSPVAGRHIQLVKRRRLAKFVGNRMFATAAANKKNLHG